MTKELDQWKAGAINKATTSAANTAATCGPLDSPVLVGSIARDSINPYSAYSYGAYGGAYGYTDNIVEDELSFPQEIAISPDGNFAYVVRGSMRVLPLWT